MNYTGPIITNTKGYAALTGIGYADYPGKLDYIPKWVEIPDRYRVEAYDIGLQSPKILILNFLPTGIDGLPYSEIQLLDSNNTPFQGMKPLMEEVRNMLKNNQLSGNYKSNFSITIDENGHISTAFGIPRIDELPIPDVLYLWNVWRHFPKETSWEMVMKLHNAVEAVKEMNRESRTNSAAAAIEAERQIIKESQERIASLEKELNEIYERAADGMNLLEDHGIDATEENLKKIDGSEDYTVSYTANDIVAHDSNISPYVLVDSDEGWATKLVTPNQELDSDMVRHLLDTYSAGYGVSYTN